MKREELAALGVEPGAVDQIMALHGRDVEKHKAAAEQWRQKYDTDTQALRQEAKQTAYQAAAQGALQSMHFSSESAKKAFAAELRAADLPVENGALTGFADFAARYRSEDPAAFAPQEAAPEKPPEAVPVAVAVRPAAGAATGVPDSALRRAFGL